MTTDVNKYNDHLDLSDTFSDPFIIIFYLLIAAFIIIPLIRRFGVAIFGGFRHSKDSIPSHWSRRTGLRVFKGINQFRYTDRFSANPSKTYFSAPRIMLPNEETFFAEGKVGGRNLWLYRITGLPFLGSGVGTYRNREISSSDLTVTGSPLNKQPAVTSERVFYGWCLEIETKKIPQSIMLTRRFIGAKDMLDTESNKFEEKYEISNVKESWVLQLLDPVLMELAHKSNSSAIEISDSSVVLYYTLSEIDFDTLDIMLKDGIKIAEQIDRNFPLAKYEKK